MIVSLDAFFFFVFTTRKTRCAKCPIQLEIGLTSCRFDDYGTCKYIHLLENGEERTSRASDMDLEPNVLPSHR